MVLRVGKLLIALRPQSFYSILAVAFLALALSPVASGIAEAKKVSNGAPGKITVRVLGLNSAGLDKRRPVNITVSQTNKVRGQKGKKFRRKIRVKGNLGTWSSSTFIKVPRGKYRVTGDQALFRDSNRVLTVAPRIQPRTFLLTRKRPKRTVTVSYKAPRPRPEPSPSPNPEPSPVKFNLTGAIGLLTTESGSRNAGRGAPRSASASNLMALLPSGEIKNAIESNDSGWRFEVKQFVVGPNGNIFVIFEWPVPLRFDPLIPLASDFCVFVEVDRGTGEAECVDPELDRVNTWNYPWGVKPEPVQFDAAGSVYYLGRKLSQSGQSETVLRRKAGNGVISDFISFPNARISQFKVTPAGAVLHSGCVYNSSGSICTGFFRVVTPSGRLRNLRAPTAPEDSGIDYLYGHRLEALDKLPDGQVYMDQAARMLHGSCDGDQFGWFACYRPVVSTYSDTTEAFSEFWLGPASIYPKHSLEEFCTLKGASASTEFPGICGFGNENLLSYDLPQNSLTVDGELFRVSANGLVIKIYPDFDAVQSSLDKVSLAEGAGNKIILAGEEAGANVVKALEIETGQENVLIPASSEIEVFNIQYSPAENKIFFDGLRYEDNKYIFGSVSLDGGNIDTEEASIGKWQQFVIFG